jgi:ribosomal protein S18 acetylase RimI-like enzyme
LSSLQFRRAGVEDADRIAALHADSWRRHYRGAYADSFLDGDVESDRRIVWSARFATPTNTETILAEQDERLVGFVHVMFDADPDFGSLVDNLHVLSDQRRTGIGYQLMVRCGLAVTERATGPGMYLWVLEQNVAAQGFYRAIGAAHAEGAPVRPPGGDPTRLVGNPRGLRMVWPDASVLGQTPATRPAPASG